MLNQKSILITGGTGSFGKKFVEIILKNYPEIKRLVIYSRDELKQYEMAKTFSCEEYPSIRYFIGDVRDGERLKRACENIDVIIHAAALKQVPAAEYNPMECIKTNVLGAENVINAAISCGVKKVIALSTDKAAAPINLYGATKLCSDKLFVAANGTTGNHDVRFSVVRYGNVFGSRGSVIPFFMERRNSGVLPITHEDMTRFHISLEEGVNMVLFAIKEAWGGETIIPKIPSYRILDVAKAVAPRADLKIVGLRPGEKIHEEMVTEMDSMNTIECKSHYVILPLTSTWSSEEFIKKFDGKKVPLFFKYNSRDNHDWLSIDQIRELIRNQIDPNFNP
ncbi:UDP-N-acetylglucosamine 4,6-dehydratase (inverting) [Bacteriovoracales bacterium]|nr:UDP-N-acetylglucosamine 4,6-dehydratase (inverting) [Bacteriovoracales bacterium]